MTEQSGRPLVAAVRSALAAGADPVRAEGQQRYMKSAMPFLGLTLPQVRAVVAAELRRRPLPGRTAWLAAVRTLWDEATHREHRYAALALLRHRRHASWLAPDEELLALLRHLVITGAWWDLVDDAAHVAGGMLRADPLTMTPVLRGWSREPDLWLRRIAIIAQLGARAHTDRDLLRYAIEGSLDDRDFFARKAIGWALREYSKTDAAWVQAFVAEHAALSPLSRREALKWLERTSGGAGARTPSVR